MCPPAQRRRRPSASAEPERGRQRPGFGEIPRLHFIGVFLGRRVLGGKAWGVGTLEKSGRYINPQRGIRPLVCSPPLASFPLAFQATLSAFTLSPLLPYQPNKKQQLSQNVFPRLVQVSFWSAHQLVESSTAAAHHTVVLASPLCFATFCHARLVLARPLMCLGSPPPSTPVPRCPSSVWVHGNPL
jgi:hypothetical protein